jgi:hypothetical protein
MLRKYKWLGTAVIASAFSLAAWAAIPARPGVLNYVEGQASVDGRTLSPQAAGNAAVDQGQVLETGNGRVEMLLTPGVFFRLGESGSARMLSPDLTNTQVELLHGQAMVEATDLHDQNNITVVEDGKPTRLDKNGLYAFNANNGTVAVFKGKAVVQDNDKSVDVKSGHELNLNGRPKAQKFDKDQARANDPLYAWSSLRSQYLSEASAAVGPTYVVNGGGGWYGPGWYWSPYWDMYAFLPGDGIFYSPFGWGYYSPWAAYYYPPVVYYRGGNYARGFYGRGARVAPRGRIATPHLNPGRSGFRGGFAAPRIGGGFAGHIGGRGGRGR